MSIDAKKQWWNTLAANRWGDESPVWDFYDLIDDTIIAKSPPEDATAYEISLYSAASQLAVRVITLREMIFEKDHPDPESWGLDADISYADGNWPLDSQIDDESFHDDTLAPWVKTLAEDIKVLLENKVVGQDSEIFDNYFSVHFNPPDDFVELLETILTTSETYLSFFPQYTIDTKLDIPSRFPTAGTEGGSAPIISDPVLEATLAPQMAGSAGKHYIAFLLDEAKSGGDQDPMNWNPYGEAYYIPVRTSPSEEGIGRADGGAGWDDLNYSLLKYKKNCADVDGCAEYTKSKSKNSFGLALPLGAPVKVT